MIFKCLACEVHIYYTAYKGSDPRNHLAHIINVSGKAIGVIIDLLNLTYALFPLQASNNVRFIIGNLDREGNVYGTDKSVWFQGRALWSFSKAYNSVEAKPEYLEAAKIVKFKYPETRFCLLGKYETSTKKHKFFKKMLKILLTREENCSIIDRLTPSQQLDH